MNRGRRSENLFSDKHDYLMFIDLLIEISEMWNANIAAYCLMTDHYHILLQTPDGNIIYNIKGSSLLLTFGAIYNKENRCPDH
ncbi:MAG: transposase [Deltaproteobacteria bacterium]|nr:transposase [Deltaproteobacteria bacterium]